MSAIAAPASTPLIGARQGFTRSRHSEAGYPEFSRMADAISLHLLVASSVQAFSETRFAYYALVSTPVLDDCGLRDQLLARPAGWPRYPVFVHRAAALLHASFRPHLAMMPLRFAN
jgi:hypothetical protein